MNAYLFYHLLINIYFIELIKLSYTIEISIFIIKKNS